MTDHIDFEKMRKRLEEEQKDLTEQVETEREKVQDPADRFNPDHTEMAYDYDYRGRHMSIVDRLQGQLDDVNRALERIEAGTYGICANCGRPIQPERLEVLPSAEFCINCQRLGALT